MMYYNSYALTDPGRVRANNEDSFALSDTYDIAVLADGMGGYNAGEVASGMATSSVVSELAGFLSAAATLNSEQVARAVKASVDQANTAILDAAMSNIHYAGMGTTLVVGVFREDRLVLGHVGDSRCYRLRGGVLRQITKDHSMLQEQVDAGIMTPEEAAVAPGKNLLTRALGVEDTVKVEIHEHLVQNEDLYLMCSDGLTDMLDDQTIASVMTADITLAAIATELVARANAHGGRDNITVLLTRANVSKDKPGLMTRLFGRP